MTISKYYGKILVKIRVYTYKAKYKYVHKNLSLLFT